MRLTTPMTAGVIALALGAAAITTTVFADDEPTPRERVEQLMPELRSDDDDVRRKAENDVFEMGTQGRAALEEISRGDDLHQALTALRLMVRDEWPRERADVEIDLAGIDREWHRALESVEHTLGEAWSDLEQVFNEREFWPGEQWPEFRIEVRDTGDFYGGGAMAADGITLRWNITADGTVRIERKLEGEPEGTVYEAASLADLREKHPEIADELSAYLPSRLHDIIVNTTDGEFVLRLRAPEVVRRARDNVFRSGETRPLLGIEWEAPSDTLRSQLSIDHEDGGMVVTRVQRKSRAAAMGLRSHDILLTLGGRTVRMPADVRQALSDAGDEPLSAEIVRRGKRLSLPE